MLLKLKNEKDANGLPCVFRTAEEMRDFCAGEDWEPLYMSAEAESLIERTADEMCGMGEDWHEYYNGAVSAYENPDERAGLIEALREYGADGLADEWEALPVPCTDFTEWASEKLKNLVIWTVKKRISAYEIKKERVRYLAEQYQTESANWIMTYGDSLEYDSQFRKLGKLYGLTREFQENGII